MEILLQIIEEEIDIAHEQLIEQYDDYSDGSGTGGPLRRDRFVGQLLSPITDIWNAIKFRAGEIGIKAVRTVGQLISNTVSGLLPFNEYSREKLNDYFENWEDKALSGLDRQFAQERKQMDEGWETFKTDFWGIGFVASPMNAIAGLAVGGKALDTAFSILNVASGGRAGAIYDLITGERTERGYRYEALEPKKDAFKDLPEDEKKKIFDEIIDNPEVIKAVNKWSAKNLPKVMGSIVKDMNQAITSGKAGNITSKEIESYKEMAPNFVTTIFDKIKGKNKKFDVEPSKEALAAANRVVADEIISMPDVVVEPEEPKAIASTPAPPKPVAVKPQR